MIIKIDDEVTVNNRGSFRSGKITDISLSLLTNDPKVRMVYKHRYTIPT